jgi:tripartite-type tricarboxylate transporter receptor subunit TctC
MENKLRPHTLFASALLIVLAASAFAAEREYPARPIRIIVPQSPGASTDLTARLVAQKLNEAFKQPVIVDNRPAPAVLPAPRSSRAAADGYTSWWSHPRSPSTPPRAQAVARCDRDFTTVSQLSKFPNMLAAHPSTPVKTLQELIALAKAKPGQLSYASAGLATGTHMTAELLKYMAGIDLLHVPYKGGGPAMAAAMGGQTQLVISTWPAGAREG